MPGLEPQSLEGLDLSERIRISRLRSIGLHGYLYLGEVLSMGRAVANCSVKLMHPKTMCSPEALVQDLREQARYMHPHLLVLQQVGVVREGLAAGWIYLSHELADYSIQDLLTRGQTLTPTQVRECLVQILEALTYLHAQGVVHGEIRPANILSTPTGWRLSGLEYRPPLSRRLDELGYGQNHFVFRAPECQERHPDQPSADIWSLGVVAHAALVGRLPFDEDSSRDRSDLLWRIVNQDPLFEDLEEPFDRLLQHCLRRDASRRWNATQALACLQGQPSEAAQASQGLSDSTWMVAAPAPLETPLLAAPPAPPAPVNNPVYVALGGALVLVGLFIGKFLLPAPPQKTQQVMAAELTSHRYQVALLDERGRPSVQPAEAPVLREDLGQGVSLELVQIPAGDFELGAYPGEFQQELDESPRHPVRVSTFYLSCHEITQQQWTVVCTMPMVERELPLSPWSISGYDLPVHNVSWFQAREFCQRLSRFFNRRHRLPREAEWEYACRGGPVDLPFHFGPVLTDQVANFAPLPAFNQMIPLGLNRQQMVAVGTFGYASHFGLYQMHGNVKEWCSDIYGAYSKRSEINPRGALSGDERVVRGGGFRSPAARCRSAARAHLAPQEQAVDVGFRVVVPEVTSGDE